MILTIAYLKLSYITRTWDEVRKPIRHAIVHFIQDFPNNAKTNNPIAGVH